MIDKWAEEVINSGKHLLVDIESTGGAFFDEAIEIAIADIANRKIVYNSLLKPTTHINPHAQRVHGIDYRMLANAPYLDQEYVKINRIIQDKVLVSYNIAFDSRILLQSYGKYDLSLPEGLSWECMMLACNKFLGKQFSLKALCDMVGIVPGNHRAKSDVIAATNVIYKFAGRDYGYKQ